MSLLDNLKLYSAAVCPFAQRVRLALREKNLRFDLVDIDLRNIPAWYRDVCPQGQVPFIEHGAARVLGSSVINEYLEDVFHEAPLLPRDPAARAHARYWIDIINSDFVPAFYRLLTSSAKARAENTAKLTAPLARFEGEGFAQHGAGPYWRGTDVSLVDIALYPFFERLCVLEHYQKFRLPAGDVRLARWHAAMQARAAVRAEFNPPEFYIRDYADYAERSKK